MSLQRFPILSFCHFLLFHSIYPWYRHNTSHNTLRSMGIIEIMKSLLGSWENMYKCNKWEIIGNCKCDNGARWHVRKSYGLQVCKYFLDWHVRMCWLDNWKQEININLLTDKKTKSKKNTCLYLKKIYEQKVQKHLLSIHS